MQCMMVEISYHQGSFTAGVYESALKRRAKRGYTYSPYTRHAQYNGRRGGPLHGVIVFPFCSTLILYEEVLVDIFTISSRLFGSAVRGLRNWPTNLIQVLIVCNMVSPVYVTPISDSLYSVIGCSICWVGMNSILMRLYNLGTIESLIH